MREGRVSFGPIESKITPERNRKAEKSGQKWQEKEKNSESINSYSPASTGSQQK